MKVWRSIVSIAMAAVLFSTAAALAAEKAATSPKEKSRTVMGVCFLHAAADELSEPDGLMGCLAEISSFCQAWGMPMDITKTTISKITGKIIIDNRQCAESVEPEYINAVRAFNLEYENYSRYESAGLPYKPLQFDIRKFVKNGDEKKQ